MAQGCRQDLVSPDVLGSAPRWGRGASRADAAGHQVTEGAVGCSCGCPSRQWTCRVLWRAPGHGGGHRLFFLPQWPLHWGGESGSGCHVPPGTAVPGHLGAGGGRGLWAPPGRAAGRSAGSAGGMPELLPALTGRHLRCVLGTRHLQEEQVWPAKGNA